MTVIIYVKEGCPYCKKVLNHLEENPREDVEVSIAEKDFKTSTFKNKYGQGATFPRGYLKKGKAIRLIGGSEDIISHLENY